MSEITLEKVDIVKERTGVTYAEAKEALENCNGDVVDALIYLEDKQKKCASEMSATKDEFVNWIKDIIKKGNVTRIRIKKEEKVLVDLPVNAGIAVTGLAYIVWSPLIALGVLTAVVTNVTVEITKTDGSVEVVNKLIKNTVTDVKDKFSGMTDSTVMKDMKDKISNFTGEVKEKMTDLKDDVKEKFTNKSNNSEQETTVYKYTVKFDEVADEKNKEESDNNNI